MQLARFSSRDTDRSSTYIRSFRPIDRSSTLFLREENVGRRLSQQERERRREVGTQKGEKGKSERPRRATAAWFIGNTVHPFSLRNFRQFRSSILTHADERSCRFLIDRSISPSRVLLDRSWKSRLLNFRVDQTLFPFLLFASWMEILNENHCRLRINFFREKSLDYFWNATRWRILTVFLSRYFYTWLVTLVSAAYFGRSRCARDRIRREKERETRSIVGDKAKCGPCDSENWNVRTGAKPRHVSIRGFPFESGCF